ncbi:MAG TPA: hypothetical protein VMW35_20820 [Myxococcota bacterium]|nr:hypothetical protein [Myxococcota bacterium]
MLLCAALAGSAFAQWPALGSTFRHDDFVYFYQAANLPPLAFLLKNRAGHLMLTCNALYFAFWRAFGLHPLPYMVAALATHLLNVRLLFALVLRLGGRAAIAGATAALWGMAPVCQGTLNWVCIYGNIVVAACVLGVLAEVAGLAARGKPPTALAPLRWAGLLLVAATSYGPGVAATLPFAAVVWLMLPPESGRLRAALGVAPAAVVLVVLYATIRPSSSVELLDPHALFGRTIVELFVDLGCYGLSAVLLGPLFTFGDDGVALGPLRGVPREALLPIAWGIAAASALVWAWAFRGAAPARRRQMLALAILPIAVYGLIALARSPMTVWFGLPLDWMASVPRYHYVATASLAGSVGLVLAEIADRVGLRIAQPLRLPGWLAPGAVVLGILAAALPYETAARAIELRFTAQMRASFADARAELRRRLDEAPPNAPVYIPNATFGGVSAIRRLVPPANFPGLAAVYVFAYPDGDPGGRSVYFVEPDAAVVAAVRAQEGTRISHILVTSDEAAHAEGAAPPAESSPTRR